MLHRPVEVQVGVPHHPGTHEAATAPDHLQSLNDLFLVASGDGDRLASIILDDAQVAIVGGNDFDAPNHVRLSYATSREKLNQAFDRIERLAREIMR